MKKISIWLITAFAMILGFTSCEVNEEFEGCPEIDITIENEPGSAVYRFIAQLEELEDVRFTWTIDDQEVTTGNIENIIGEILDYRFEPGKHTVCVKVASDDCPIQVCKEIEVERDENDPCPDLFFESRTYERPSTYKFIADFEGIERVHYEWFIDGELVEDSNANDPNYLIWNFEEPGVYEVCIKAETPDCPEGTSYCKEIRIEESDLSCPQVAFEKEMEPGTDGTYVFEAVIEGNDEVSEILWFVNGEHVENPTDQQGGERVLVQEFAPGVYEVCLKVVTENCPDGVTYCKEIRVDGGCPELSFEAEQDGDNAAYYFYPGAFDGIDDVKLEWFVNGEYAGSSPEFPHNNPFYFQFDGPGSYEVCLMIETPECPNGTSFCKVIEIDGGCPSLSFEHEQEGDTPGYNFYANFDHKENTSYEWIINGDVVDREIVNGNEEKDDYMYYQFGPGTYEICIIAETPDCPQGITYCKTLVIE
ncbi:hypothetical protein M0D21_14490 [Aquimarina sp. D1M17]|uniref:hypothetical protein n=1 Tax=Aquimarina acroporae TaxID=2937283 RepID=UPI0020BEFBC0|nr:hypothetical protein [Aquimarina acroporae]MCK8522786.1 hypothetical protein [Aquimarina acroporae]